MTESVYRAAGFFMVRTPTLPADEFLSITGGSADDARRRLRELAEEPLVRQALHVASPSLTAGLAHLGGSSKKSARAYSSLLRYLARMSTRPTPYGLFSGIGVGRFAERTTLALAADPVGRTRTRADLGWLLTVIKGLDEDEAFPDETRVAVHPMLYQVGDRAVLPYADVHGQADNRNIGFRLTAPAAIAVRMAGRPGTTVGDIARRIVEEVPGATGAKARGLVKQLWDLHVLTSDLRPAMTVALPEQDLLKRLDQGEVRDGLERTRALATAVDECAGRADVSTVDELVRQQRAMAPEHTKDTFQLDTALAITDADLSSRVAADAAEAAELLLRVGSSAKRRPHLVEYHTAFLERYGIGAEVPVLDLLSPERGLDAPATYTMPTRTTPLPRMANERDNSRDLILMPVLAEALRSGQDEIELTDELLERLTTWRPTGEQARCRPSLDLYAQVAASSREAVDSGDYRFVVAPGTMTDGGRTFGRFFDLVDGSALAELREFARAEEALCPDLVFADLSYASPRGRNGNVAVHPQVRSYEICVNTAPSVPEENQILLSDIVVGATVDRFYLRSRRLDKELRVTQGHMLNPSTAPNVCRFLLELSEDGFAPLADFDWGAATAFPHLPRVRRGRIVLSPARWHLFTHQFPEDGAEFAESLSRWRAEWRVPRHVFLAVFDNRLALDLEHPLCVAELHAELARARRADQKRPVVLHELLPDFSQAWLSDVDGRGYFSEIVVPMLARTEESVRRKPVALDPPAHGAASRRRLAGDEWIYLKLYSALTQHDDIVGGPMPELAAALRAEGVVDRWFFIRYADPYPHLRFRLHVPDPGAVPGVLARVLAWGKQVVEAGLANDIALSSYDVELERYGGPEAYDAVEATFEANSAVCAGLVRYLRANPDLSPDVVCTMAQHSLYRDWGAAPSTVDTVPDAMRTRFKEVRTLLCDLLEPWDAHPDPVARQHLDALTTILAGQRESLRAAGERVRELAAAGRLVGTEGRVLGSLAHMQANRLLGIDNERENECYQLWSLALRLIKGRPA
ncbi:lantibiotic dehydratase [Allokutzneria sp. A3M-2-11 16]|uniref:lantibiotic dehydratase n=1 Tax=Allokutzneria sp. A3M-2-11 16 TaxID=2962043 RepID=UPI0020B659D9|nr:lantibiotic dehydratase [Allokutzneria sp. A3M-2-11 16]MCP3802260.1 lantibiotic dehydratase [Allokutzneria sp. A3M-2-11 16]